MVRPSLPRGMPGYPGGKTLSPSMLRGRTRLPFLLEILNQRSTEVSTRRSARRSCSRFVPGIRQHSLRGGRGRRLSRRKPGVGTSGHHRCGGGNRGPCTPPVPAGQDEPNNLVLRNGKLHGAPGLQQVSGLSIHVLRMNLEPDLVPLSSSHVYGLRRSIA